MQSTIEWLETLKSSGAITPLDYHLASLLTEHCGVSSPLSRQRFMFLVVWLSIEVRAGHVCVNLTDLTPANFAFRFKSSLLDEILIHLNQPTLNDWHELCCDLTNQAISQGERHTPLIFQNDRLYFHRMWLYEVDVAHYFKQIATRQTVQPSPELNQQMASIITQLFPQPPESIIAQQLIAEQANYDPNQEPNQGGLINWQKLAVATAMIKQVTIISGGPGTGKTTTVAKILAGLILLQQAQGFPAPRICAAAPTGKAAARLTESLALAVANLAVDAHIKSALPTDAVTLHRLLGAKIDSNSYTYHQHNKLHYDVVLVDEASMIDLAMMASLIAALPSSAKLILLGDKEQLSSVEAGAVFGDLCELVDYGYSATHTARLLALTGYQLVASSYTLPIADNICLLKQSYRFDENSGIGQLANLIKNGHDQQAYRLLNKSDVTDIRYTNLVSQASYSTAIDYCASQYHYYLTQIKHDKQNIGSILQAFGQFRLLCALREGPFGVWGLNRAIEAVLQQRKLIQLHRHDPWYIGRPIMILKNSAELGIFNGDIGITLPSLDNPSKLRVYFLLSNGAIQGFSPYRLPEHETAYCMTVHKSQGSEFERLAVILPTEYSPLLNRSLLYTAITRGKSYVALYATMDILSHTIRSNTKRESGLLNQLSS